MRDQKSCTPSLATTAKACPKGRSLAATLIVGLLVFLGACSTTDAPSAATPQLKTTAACSTTNLAKGRPASASSTENGSFVATAAFDGNANTRWSSKPSDNQWIQVNLGGSKPLCQVVLKWETAYGQAFRLETSDDNTTWTPIYETTQGKGGDETLAVSGSGKYVRLSGQKRGTGYGYSLLEFEVYGEATSGGMPGMPNMPEGMYVPANPPVTGVVPSSATPPHRYFHEFQANCSVSRSTLPDDPIVYFGKPGASHMHTFLGNATTNAGTTLASLQAGGTSCLAPGDKSAYWMPTMYNGDAPVLPVGKQVIYYKTGVLDYTSVRPFPLGLRFIVGDMMATPAEFLAGSFEGWECGESYYNADFPAYCPPESQLNVRYQAPSCWDGLHLDSPDHKSHMAYPVDGRCTASHPVAVPMLEFKMAFPASGDTSRVRLSSGRGYSFHYDFYNAWDPATLKALVNQCIVGGLQCNARGYDETHPEAGAALNADYRLP